MIGRVTLKNPTTNFSLRVFCNSNLITENSIIRNRQKMMTRLKFYHSFFNLSRSFHTSPTRLATLNPYKVLGLSNSATQQEVKQRYRELAKQHHPDLNPGPDAAEKMARISSAYQLLSNPAQRQFYDQTGMAPEEAGVNTDNPGASAFSGFGNVDPSFMFTDFTSFFTNSFGGGRANANAPHKGEDVATEITLDFLEAARGCQKNVTLQRNCSCSECNGTGCSPGTSLATCKSCNGTGTVKIERGPIIFGTVCSRCSGSGQIVPKPCKACKGAGVKAQSKVVDIDFPAGVRSGMEVRISGEGHSGSRGGRGGDLFVKVNVRPHPQFKIVNDEIHVTVPLSLKECLLGDEISIPTLDGNFKFTIPAGTKPGDVKILRGKGIKRLQERGYGDLAIHWTLKTSTNLNQRQKELILEFDAIERGIHHKIEPKQTQPPLSGTAPPSSSRNPLSQPPSSQQVSSQIPSSRTPSSQHINFKSPPCSKLNSNGSDSSTASNLTAESSEKSGNESFKEKQEKQKFNIKKENSTMKEETTPNKGSTGTGTKGWGIYDKLGKMMSQ